MFNILSLLIDAQRVTRKVDASTFVMVPGLWAEQQTDGSVVNVTAGSPAVINRLIITSSSGGVNVYETQDVKVNRITSLESPGMRCECDSDVCVLAGLAIGEDLVVSTEVGAEGKLAATTQVADGDYEIVARVLAIANGILTFVTVSSYMVTIVNPTTTTTVAPTTTTTVAPTTTTTVAPTTTTTTTTTAAP